MLNKTKKARVINTNRRLELSGNEIRNGIQKSRLRWFGHVMRMREERIPKKLLLYTQKWRENYQGVDPEPDG